MKNGDDFLPEGQTLDGNPKGTEIFENLTAISLNILHWESLIQVQKKAVPGVKGKRVKKGRYSFDRYQLYPKAATNFYFRIRNVVLNLLNEIGFEFMGFWVFPSVMIKYVHKEMMTYYEEYMKNVDLIKKNHDTYITAWKKENPDKISLLKKDKHSLENILKKFDFTWYFFKISLVDNVYLRQSFLAEVNNIEYYLYKGMAKKAHDLWRDIFSKDKPCLADSVEHFRVFRDKMKGLSFINPQKMGAMTRLIDVFLAQARLTGKLSMEEYRVFQKLTLLFKNVESCSKCADLILKTDMTFSTLIKVVDNLVMTDLEEQMEDWEEEGREDEPLSSWNRATPQLLDENASIQIKT